jgi:DNA adenine methylase
VQYQGGKFRIAKQLVACMPDKARVWEPFCGGLHVSMQLAARPGLRELVCSDARECLISLYQHVQAGGDLPEAVSEDEYKAARLLPDSDPHKAFALIGCAWGGKYNGGYARDRDGQNYARTARESLVAAGAKLQACKVAFERFNFFDIAPGIGDALIYCDPPYAGTEGYKDLPFDHDAFWARAREHAEAGSTIYVSEYSAPGGWVVVWEEATPRKSSECMRRTKPRPRDRLYTWGDT